MAALFEESLICKLLEAPDLEMLHSNGVTEEALEEFRAKREVS